MILKEKKVTLDDIARELDISKNAVSLALRGKDGVSKELREKVIAKANEMQYQGLGKVQGCILTLIPQRFTGEGSSFYHRLCFEMEAYAASLGFQLIISSVSEMDEVQCRPPCLLSTVPCRGVITVGNLSRAYCRMIQKLGIRYVMADQYYEDIPMDSVTTANTSGAYLMTSHLIDNGHRSIQFFGTSFRTSSLEDRWIGYKRAMREHDLPVLSNPMQRRNLTAESYELICEALDEMPEMPTAFVCGHDVTAHDLIRALEQRGLHCPEDVSVVGFDNVQSYDILSLNLTTYSTPSTGIAHAAIDLLQSETGEYARRIQLFGEPVYRGSVRRLNA